MGKIGNRFLTEHDRAVSLEVEHVANGTAAPLAAGHDYLVQIHVAMDPATDASMRTALVAAERERGAELVRAGTIRNIWRIPGSQSNVGVWRASDPTALHDLISSLPLFAYMTVTVTPLAAHPLAPILAEVGS
jgi:muconolactone D-isomerase